MAAFHLRVLSRRERLLLVPFGWFLLMVGLALLFDPPRPVGMIGALISVGLAVVVAGVVGRLPVLRSGFPGYAGPGPSPVSRPANGKDHTMPDQTVTHVTIAGVHHPRIRCDSETELEGWMDFCGDCSAKAGQYHALGCDLEECPKCYHQMISCGCGIQELRPVK